MPLLKFSSVLKLLVLSGVSTGCMQTKAQFIFRFKALGVTLGFIFYKSESLIPEGFFFSVFKFALHTLKPAQQRTIWHPCLAHGHLDAMETLTVNKPMCV